ncbi:MAG: GTP-binding protein [Firmicutes bacterium]|nr:GTP-binding protein [Bacillota bacterium]
MTKIDIISGFLGSGKTTLIRKLLNETLKNEKVVLIENEFGEIDVDSDFLKDTSIEIKSINAGCICCSLQGDFEEALKKVIETYNPDRIIIEPSGVGKLSDVTKAVKTVEEAKINALCTIVDARKCKIYAKNFKEFFNDQIKAATCIIMSKTQTISEEKLKEAYAIIKEINPEARIMTTAWDNLYGSTILTVMEQNINILDDEHECSCGCGHHHHDEHCECGHDHHHDDHCECEHDHHHDEHCECGHEHHHDEHCECGHDHHHHHHDHDADEIFNSVGFETIRKYSKQELETMLSKLDENILRAKGIVENVEGGWINFDYVSGDIDIREGNPAYTGLISVIGSHVDHDTIKEIFNL